MSGKQECGGHPAQHARWSPKSSLFKFVLQRSALSLTDPFDGMPEWRHTYQLVAGFPEDGWMLQVAEGQQRLLKLAEEAAGAT